MNILHVIPSIALKNGGPSRSSINLVNHLVEIDNCKIAFLTYHQIGERRLEFSPKVKLCFANRSSFLESLFCVDANRHLLFLFDKFKPDLVHIHGIWHPLTHLTAKVSSKRRVPYVIQPRGMVEPWALQHNGFKKSLAMRLYQYADFESASGFIATSEEEVSSIRALGVGGRIAMIPNGVECPSSNATRRAPDGVKHALFMSRIHPKKGLSDLIEAWSKLRPHGWILRIVGPDDGHEKVIRSLIQQRDLKDLVKIVGPKYDEDRANEFASADLFILPTYSENFGIVIAEALSYGLPVVTTTAAPWSSLRKYNCGWWIKPGVSSLTDNLPSALDLSDDERIGMGIRARQLAMQFRWAGTALKTYQFYDDILNSGVR